MSQQNTETRNWDEIDNEELDYILSHNKDKHVLRMAKSEQRKRMKAQKVGTRSVQVGNRQQIEIVAIRLTVADWFGVMFRALPAIFIGILIIVFVLFLIEIALLNHFLEALLEELKKQ